MEIKIGKSFPHYDRAGKIVIHTTREVTKRTEDGDGEFSWSEECLECDHVNGRLYAIGAGSGLTPSVVEKKKKKKRILNP